MGPSSSSSSKIKAESLAHVTRSSAPHHLCGPTIGPRHVLVGPPVPSFHILNWQHLSTLDKWAPAQHPIGQFYLFKFDYNQIYSI